MGIYYSYLISREYVLEGKQLADKLKLLYFQSPQHSLHQAVENGGSISSAPFLFKQLIPLIGSLEYHAAVILAETFSEPHCSLSIGSNPTFFAS